MAAIDDVQTSTLRLLIERKRKLELEFETVSTDGAICYAQARPNFSV
jgi:hypothetical protein